MNNVKPVIIAGGGLWGCTVARALADNGFTVQLLEKRSTLGGMAQSKIDKQTGIEIHMHGPHVFHTDSETVWKFIRRFTKINRYCHKMMTVYNDRTYFLPVNLSLINQFFGTNMTPNQAKAYMTTERKSQIINAFFEGYTRKQWGKTVSEISPDIIKRIPIQYTYDLNYFDDYYQGIPVDGYCKMFERMISHPLIKIATNSIFTLDKMKNSHVFYSGSLDELFEFKYGRLPYRSLDLKFRRIRTKDYQGTAVLNYADFKTKYTRVTEFKYFHPESKKQVNLNATIICEEYPKKAEPSDELYYPENSTDNKSLYKKYLKCAQKYQNLKIGGRLGLYRYLDMDETIEHALNTVQNYLSQPK